MAMRREASVPSVRASAIIKWCALGGSDPPPTAPADCKLTVAEVAEVWGPPGQELEFWAWDSATLSAQYEATARRSTRWRHGRASRSRGAGRRLSTCASRSAAPMRGRHNVETQPRCPW